MRNFDCFCGVRIEAEGLDGLVPLARAHMNDVHNLNLSEANTRDNFEAEDRLAPVRPRQEVIGVVEIHQATPDRLDDVCFVVAPPYRKHGLAAKLLGAACESFVDCGFSVAEAYPNKNPSDEASAYHGPISMYFEAGFTEVGPLDEHLTVVQKVL